MTQRTWPQIQRREPETMDNNAEETSSQIGSDRDHFLPQVSSLVTFRWLDIRIALDVTMCPMFHSQPCEGDCLWWLTCPNLNFVY